MDESASKPMESTPILPPLPDYGVFLRTPADGHDWFHPEDEPLIRGLIPSNRVFCRYHFDGEFYHFRYGSTQFRLRPCLWLPVAGEGIDIGDQVETIGVGMQVELFVSEVVGMHFSQRDRRILYQLASHPISDRMFTHDQLRLLADKSELRPANTFVHVPRGIESEGRELPIERSLQVPTDEEADHGSH